MTVSMVCSLNELLVLVVLCCYLLLSVFQYSLYFHVCIYFINLVLCMYVFYWYCAAILA